jgi:transglutaminase-like putative cysteine protease
MPAQTGHMDTTGGKRHGSNVGCELTVEIDSPASLVVQVAVARRPGVSLEERLEVTGGPPSTTVHEFVGADGDRQHLVHAEPGTLTLRYEAKVTRPDDPEYERVTDEQRFVALRPSRYCPSDRIAGFARSRFGDLPTAAQRVHAICEYVWTQLTYEAETSGPGTDAVDTLLSGRGVCRDFAHLVAALCRAVEVPARTVSVYAPGLSPMDFHAVVEAAIDGLWRVWDATRLAPRPTLVRIATGRDAADTAFMTVLSGRAVLRRLGVTAVSAGDLPFDGHVQSAVLA